ncbi:MAG: superoxide dismutase family protein [Clostridiales bacterium]|jgi:Cu-Zn family superoxide dismutase|nr:superoxide dismutase family protein [Clostridiales bacterium]
MERGKRNSNDTFFGETPVARAILKGSALNPEITGVVQFYPYREGALVVVEVSGLPEHIPAILDKPPVGPFGFHIHEGGTCGVTTGDQPFQTAGAHYNPTNQHHPQHAGDLPVLFSNDGYAWMAVYTNRFHPSQVIGRTVMIHQNPDDFRSQPAGNSGVRIACGVIERLK